MNTKVNTDAKEGNGFDKGQIPEEVRKEIEREARKGYLPQERYDQSVGKLKDRLADLETKVQEPKKAEKTYTRSQLRALVDEGQITEDQMDAQIEKQMVEKARQAAQTTVAEKTSEGQTASTISQYRELVQDLDVDGSDNRERAREAFKSIVAIAGMPATRAEQDKLEVLALQQAFGPLKALQNKGRDLSKSHRETYQEVGGDHGEEGKSPETKGLSKRVVDYYGPQVEKGMTTWADVKDELKYVTNPAVRERLGLKDNK